jgi:hypothetical protein
MLDASQDELESFLDSSSTVGRWESGPHRDGAVIYEAMAFDPDALPAGWEVTQVAGRHVHIGVEE